MKRQKEGVREKKVLSMMLAVTLSISPIVAMGNVEAKGLSVLDSGEEKEYTSVLSTDEETGDLSVQEEIMEKAKDKEYVVYIEVSDETQSVADDGHGNEASKDADTADQLDSENANTADNQGNEIVLSEITVSENIMNEASVITNEAKTTKIGTISNDSEKTPEEIQESIEEAEELIINQAEGQELVKDEETIIYAADLTQKEIETLEESDATIYVEENIELFGADNKAKKKESNNKKTDEKKSKENDHKNSEKKQQESSDMKEKKLAYKKSLIETKDEEPEWNIRMVNAEDSVTENAGGNKKADKAVANESAHNQTEEGTGNPIKIALMDSGIELLAGIPVQQIVNLVPDEQDLPYYMNDMTGHGTAVAGIINDIAPNAEIYSVKIMDAENKATLSRVVEGIYWCIENDMDIINMSFGTQTESQVLKKAIEDAHKAGILTVSSAGNGGLEGVEYPAAFEEVIAVGAVGTNAGKTKESAVGEEVELVAPGEEIISDSMLGLQTVVSGTSMAAPHVTGAAAVLWQKDNTKSPEFIRGLLSQAANDLGNEEEYGNGLVDLAYALERYEEYAAEYQKVVAEETTREDVKGAINTTQTEEETVNIQEEITAPVASRTKLTEEILIEENETPVETFEEVDYVEGRWGGKKGHLVLVDNANEGFLDNTEVEIFKLGAVYPDKVFPVKYDTANKIWHGGAAVNYMANYINATKIAKAAGDVGNAASVCKEEAKSFELMKFQINSKRIQYQLDSNGTDVIVSEQTWNQILGTEYQKANSNEKKRLRKLFLYGMASHILTDTFAHSAYYKKGGKYIKINHPDADEVTYIPNRFIDAQEAMSMAIVNYIAPSTIGSEIDFSPEVRYWGKNRGYYLKNLLKYARAVSSDSTESELLKMFKAINCD